MQTNNEITVEIKNLHKSFGTLKAVNDVSFNVKGGEIHGFIGPNGAGKTTTMRIMATLDVPDSGDVIINDISVTGYPDKLRPIIGFMPDYLDTYKNVLVYEYLDFYARVHKLPVSYRNKRLKDVVEFTGLEGMLNKPIDGLSKGMKQRLSLGRILINDPKLLIMDEPAAGLDPRARIELRELCLKLAERGKAILISSHILSELSEVCSSVTIIEEGRIHTTDSIKNIIAEVDVENKVAIKIHCSEKNYKSEIDKLLNCLAETTGITDVNKELNLVSFSYNGDEEFKVLLLQKLIANNIPISDFHTATSGLEDIFMSVTEGKVN